MPDRTGIVIISLSPSHCLCPFLISELIITLPCRIVKYEKAIATAPVIDNVYNAYACTYLYNEVIVASVLYF